MNKFVLPLIVSVLTVTSIASGQDTVPAEAPPPVVPEPAPEPVVPPPATPPVTAPEVYITPLQTSTVAPKPTPRFRYVGMQLDLGVPDGAAAGIVVRPGLNWLRTQASITHNGVAAGFRGGVTLDPINFPIAMTLTLEGGTTGRGSVPGLSSLPDVSYDYANLHGGLEFGSRDSFRFFLRVGPTWMKIRTYDFAKAIDNKDQSLVISDPTASVRLMPTFKLGFALYF